MIVLNVTESGTKEADKIIESWATGDDREYAARRKNGKAAHNSLLARSVLRRLLADNDFDWNAEIAIDDGGKPFIEDGPHISISHSKDMIAVALCGDFAVGVDIEYWKDRDFAKLAKYVFGPEEVKVVAADGVAEFYRIWTAREAIAKVTGVSIFTGMGEDIDSAKWQVFYEIPKDKYSLALASKARQREEVYVYQ